MKPYPCVYLLSCEENDNYKIGYTTQKIKTRIKQIEQPTGNPFRQYLNIYLDDQIWCKDVGVARSLEQAIHHLSKHYRVAGREWFEPVPHAFSDQIQHFDKRPEVWDWKDVVRFHQRVFADDAADACALYEFQIHCLKTGE